ncbi:SAM-dependent methyltransferase [Amphritea sp. ZJ14W]|uniref:SAM-dependent methyltransferase n=2 Tax=Amphritea pacifica TaxID=2811233 RepID=A0ABS2W861_9GAMM|nr:SAM-dependent methyltransferase [Amphritea pacifica]MBN1005511.1 SAM-dependent methyltransferase [Amphritea pacifica]
MFMLSDADLKKHILGCSDGPAAFNAGLSARGGRVVSVDPVYQFSAEQIWAQIERVYPQVMLQMQQNADHYIWDSISSVEVLGATRMDAMQQFLADFETGLEAGRYLTASLPDLPFGDRQFELALCSHFLFLYSEHFSLVQHIESMRELCRVAEEVRVYPLLTLDGKPSDYLPAVREALSTEGIETCLQTVDYQFQKGATQMLIARA